MKIKYNSKSKILTIDMEGNKIYSNNPNMFEIDLDSEQQIKDSGICVVVSNGHFVSNVSGNLLSFGSVYINKHSLFKRFSNFIKIQ